MWLHSLKVAQLLRSAACLHTNQSRSYLNHLVYRFVYYFPHFTFSKFSLASSKCSFNTSSSSCVNYFSSCHRLLFSLLSVFFLHRKLLNLTIFSYAVFKHKFGFCLQTSYLFPTVLGPFSNLGKVTVSFIMSVRLSSHMEQLGYHRKCSYEI